MIFDDFPRFFRFLSILRTRDLKNYPTNRAQTAGRVSPDTLVRAKHFLPQWDSFKRLEFRQKNRKHPSKIIENPLQYRGPRGIFSGIFRFCALYN